MFFDHRNQLKICKNSGSPRRLIVLEVAFPVRKQRVHV